MVGAFLCGVLVLGAAGASAAPEVRHLSLTGRKGSVDTPTKSLGTVKIKSGPGTFDKANRRFPLTMRLV